MTLLAEYFDYCHLSIIYKGHYINLFIHTYVYILMSFCGLKNAEFSPIHIYIILMIILCTTEYNVQQIEMTEQRKKSHRNLSTSCPF